jgi:hypothetical protein
MDRADRSGVDHRVKLLETNLASFKWLAGFFLACLR